VPGLSKINPPQCAPALPDIIRFHSCFLQLKIDPPLQPNIDPPL